MTKVPNKYDMQYAEVLYRGAEKAVSLLESLDGDHQVALGLLYSEHNWVPEGERGATIRGWYREAIVAELADVNTKLSGIGFAPHEYVPAAERLKAAAA